jgi:thioredoxin 2
LSNRPLLLVCPGCGSTNRVDALLLDSDPACGRCGGALMAPRPFALTDALLPKFIARTDLPLVVDFRSPSSKSCREMAPQYELTALRMPHTRFAILDTDRYREAAVDHRVRSIPTLLLFRGGREVDRHLGAHRAAELLAWLRGHEAAAL